MPLKQITTLEFAKVSDTQLTVEIIPNIYPASGCTGTPAQLPHAGTGGNTMTIDALVTAAVVGNKLQTGGDTLGADGYPTAFDPVDTLTKQ